MQVVAGDLHRDYEPIGLVHGFAGVDSANTGCSGSSANLQSPVLSSTESLIKAAEELGADAVINVSYQQGEASKSGCGNPQVSREVYAWGTAIKFR